MAKKKRKRKRFMDAIPVEVVKTAKEKTTKEKTTKEKTGKKKKK